LSLKGKLYSFSVNFYNRHFKSLKWNNLKWSTFGSYSVDAGKCSSYYFLELTVQNWTGPSLTRGSVGWACVAHLSFCFEET
jgi:hypothetical protein